MIDKKFWSKRKVFLTGHTGFKGGWLSLWLNNLNCDITGYSLKAPTNPAIFFDTNVGDIVTKNIEKDVRNFDNLKNEIQQAEPEIVIHMAAQSLVRESYEDPKGTFSTNVMGTVNVLESVRSAPSVKAVLIVTTDKCYENREWLWGYRENDRMGGHDPYSSSKACAELAAAAYRKSFFQNSGVAVATARAGNVIGGGDWSKDRIVPDAVRAFKDGKKLVVRNPLAIRPWQYVLEPLGGYLLLCQKLVSEPVKYSEAWNFGPNSENEVSVRELVEYIARTWGNNAVWQQDQQGNPHEARTLKLDCSKANALLNWKPIWTYRRALEETIGWYRAWTDDGKNMQNITLQYIDKFQREMNNG